MQGFKLSKTCTQKNIYRKEIGQYHYRLIVKDNIYSIRKLLITNDETKNKVLKKIEDKIFYTQEEVINYCI